MPRTATIYRVDDDTAAERYGIEPRVLGGSAGVWRRLRRGLPGLYARGWEGWLVGDGWRMHLSTWRHLLPSERGAVDSIQVDVDGEGDPLPLLVSLCREHGWSLFDDQSGCFVDLDDPAGMSWHGAPLEAASPRRSLAMLLVPEALRFELSRREVLLVDLDGPPPEERVANALPRFPLGHADDVRDALIESLPTLRFFGRRGRAVGDGLRVDVLLRSEGLIDTLRISVSGPRADEWLGALCEARGWSAWEPATDAFPYLHATAREVLPAELPSNVIALRPR